MACIDLDGEMRVRCGRRALSFVSLLSLVRLDRDANDQHFVALYPERKEKTTTP